MADDRPVANENNRDQEPIENGNNVIQNGHEQAPDSVGNGSLRDFVSRNYHYQRVNNVILHNK